MNPVLFISHNATRTGAPMVLLHLCRWLSEHHPRGFEVVLGDGGDLEADFKALGPTTILGRVADPAGAGARLEALRERAARREFALVYANTVEVGDILDACAAPATPVVTHVHELDFWIRHQTGLERFAVVRDHTDRFIAVSEAVRTNLVTNRGVDAAAIDSRPRVHRHDPLAAAARGAARRRLGARHPGACVDRRRFGHARLAQGPRPVRPGRRRGAPPQPRSGRCTGFGSAARPAARPSPRCATTPSASASDRASTSSGNSASRRRSSARSTCSSRRPGEDPYPLVNLEAAAAATPIVCFDGSGGARELVEDDCGAVTPYLDVAAMADAVVRMLVSEAERRRAGARARAKVCERHDVTVAAPQVADSIERAIAAGPTAARLARTATRLRRPCAVPSPPCAPTTRWSRSTDWRPPAQPKAGTSVHARSSTPSSTRPATAIPSSRARRGTSWRRSTSTPDEALRCCERALALLPTHRAARDLRDALTATVLHG